MSMYRSQPPAPPPHDPELAALEASILRTVLIRRLVIGFGALAFGIASFVIGGMILVRTFGHFGGRGGVRVGAMFFAAGLSLSVVAFRILRVGEIHGPDHVTRPADPIAWSTLALVTSGIMIVVGLVAAWPLGIYRWVDTLASPCRKVITHADAERLGLSPFDVGHIQNDTLVCSLNGTERGTDKRTFAVILAGDMGGSQFPNELRFLGGKRTPIEGLGDEAYLIERSGENVVIAKRRHAAVIVHMASRLYDRDAAMRVAEHLKGRMSLVEIYADAWEKEYPRDP